jgi:acetyl esterase/lipase
VVLHGTLDEQVPVELSRALAEADRAAGGAIDYRELPGCEHFGLIDPLAPEWAQVRAALSSLARD